MVEIYIGRKCLDGTYGTICGFSLTYITCRCLVYARKAMRKFLPLGTFASNHKLSYIEREETRAQENCV